MKSLLFGFFLSLLLVNACPAQAVDAGAEAAAYPPLRNDGSWVVTASSNEKDYRPELAVDGDRSSRWSSAFSDDQWWQVDLGAEHVLQSVSIDWEYAHAAAYRVMLSTDGDVWDTVLEERAGKAGLQAARFEPRPARYVKILCDRRATGWGFSFHEVEFNAPEPPGMTATASSGTGDYAPRFAIDGDRTTRWSSNFSDDEWWQVQFDAPRVLTGMRILWETAFAEKYDVAVSDDGHAWRTVYEVTEGDGQTDVLLFAPVETTFLRLNCKQRGTGWGHSIYELEFFGDRHRVAAVASSEADGFGAERLVDGDRGTAWRSAAEQEQWIRVELSHGMHLGGVELQWGENYAKAYDVEWSEDGSEWIVLYREEDGNGGKDYVFFPAVSTRHIRILCRRSNAGRGYELAHLELKSGEEQASPLRAYQAKARDAQPGRYPMWLLRRQEFWTVVGLSGDDQESLLGETGTFEPYKGGFSVQPLVVADGTIFSWADVELAQKLEDDYLPLPTVSWSAADWGLDISAVALGKPGAAYTAVRYRLSNRGAAERAYTLVLAVRPVQLNPAWQSGGMSRIEAAECLPGGAPPSVRVNHRTGIMLPTRPAGMGAAALADGDINDYLARDGFPDAATAEDPEGQVGVGIRYAFNLPAGASRDVVVLYPLHDEVEPGAAWAADPNAAFERAWSATRGAWEGLLNRIGIDIPEMRLIHTLKSNLAYVLINHDAPWFKPGSRNYNHSWMRDGALTGLATLRMGKPELVKEFIENFSRFVSNEGWVPYIILENGQPIGFNPDMNGGEGHEFDSQGEFVFIVRQYYDFTGDDELVKSVYPSIVRALEYGREIRKRRLTDSYKDTVYWGILPHSNSHEGYYPAKHSYWDNFWMLRGLKDGAYLADRLGHPGDAEWMRDEEAELRERLLDSIMAVIRRDQIAYIPGCAELGDEDPTSTSIAIMACDETGHLPQPYLDQTFERYHDRISKRHAGTADTFTPYEVRNADVFIRLGQRDRALAMLRHFMSESMRPHNWNHMAEVVHATPRAPSYIGDMPHTWVGSDYINAVRSMFSYVHEDTLMLAAGVDPAWLAQGVTVRNLPTPFGAISYRLKESDSVVRIGVAGEARPPRGFRIPLPESWQDRRVTVNGAPVELVEGAVVFSALPVRIELEPAVPGGLQGTEK